MEWATELQTLTIHKCPSISTKSLPVRISIWQQINIDLKILANELLTPSVFTIRSQARQTINIVVVGHLECYWIQEVFHYYCCLNISIAEKGTYEQPATRNANHLVQRFFVS